MNTGKKTKMLTVSDLKYEDIEVTTKTVEKQVPKTIIEEIEEGIPITEESEEEKNKESNQEEQALADTDPVTPEDGDNVTEGQTASKGDGAAETDGNAKDTLEVENEKPKTTTVVKKVEKVVYETVTEEITEETLKGTYSDYSVQQLYYNTGNDTLLLVGKFTKYQSARSHQTNNVTLQRNFDITNGKAEFYSDVNLNSVLRNLKGYRSYYNDDTVIIGNMPDGKLLCNIVSSTLNDCGIYRDYYYARVIIDLKNSSSVIGIDNNILHNSISLAYINGNGIYGFYFGCLYKYSFSSGKWENLWEDRTPYNFQGIRNSIIYLWDTEDGSITTIAYDGEPIKKKNIDLKTDIEVLDFTNMPNEKTGGRMFITENESFIFYDTDAGAWRKISKNK